MPYASLQSTSLNRGRATIVVLGSLALLVLMFSVIPFRDLSPALKFGGVVVALATYGTVFVVGIRKWAGPWVRYELDDGGLSVFGARGELRERLRWSEMRTYVVDTITPSSKVRCLTITRSRGGLLRIPEVREPGRAQEFDRFCKSFLDAVRQQRATEPTAAIREGVSFYDKPVALVLGVLVLVLVVGFTGAAFIFPAELFGREDVAGMRIRAILFCIVAAPFVARTVIGRRPQRRGEEQGRF